MIPMNRYRVSHCWPLLLNLLQFTRRRFVKLYTIVLQLWWLTPLSTIFQIYHGGSFIGEKNRSTRKKPIDLTLVIDKHYHIMWHRVRFAWAGFELTTLVVISTDCVGSCKSNYHMTTTAPDCPVTVKLSTSIYSIINQLWYISQYDHEWWTCRLR